MWRGARWWLEGRRPWLAAWVLQVCCWGLFDACKQVLLNFVCVCVCWNQLARVGVATLECFTSLTAMMVCQAMCRLQLCGLQGSTGYGGGRMTAILLTMCGAAMSVVLDLHHKVLVALL